MFPHLGFPPTSSILIQFWRLSRGNAGTWNTGAATTGIAASRIGRLHEYRGSTAKLNKTEDLVKCRFIPFDPTSKSFKIYGRMMLYEGDNLVKLGTQSVDPIAGRWRGPWRGIAMPALAWSGGPSEVPAVMPRKFPLFSLLWVRKGWMTPEVYGFSTFTELDDIGWWEHVKGPIRAQFDAILTRLSCRCSGFSTSPCRFLVAQVPPLRGILRVGLQRHQSARWSQWAQIAATNLVKQCQKHIYCKYIYILYTYIYKYKS